MHDQDTYGMEGGRSERCDLAEEAVPKACKRR